MLKVLLGDLLRVEDEVVDRCCKLGFSAPVRRKKTPLDSQSEKLYLGTVDFSIPHPQILYSPPNTRQPRLSRFSQQQANTDAAFTPTIQGSRSPVPIRPSATSLTLLPAPTALNAPTKNRFNFPPPHPVKSHQTLHAPRSSATCTPNWNFVGL